MSTDYALGAVVSGRTTCNRSERLFVFVPSGRFIDENERAFFANEIKNLKIVSKGAI